MARKKKQNNATANLKLMKDILQKECSRAERAMQEINNREGAFSQETNEWLLEMGHRGEVNAKLLYFGQAIRGLAPGCDWALMEEWAHDIVKIDAGMGYFMLGSLYSPGVPGFEDEQKALMYYQKGADTGHEACSDLLKDEEEDEDVSGLIRFAPHIENEENENPHKERHYILQELGNYKAARKELKLWYKDEPQDAKCLFQMAAYYANGLGVTKNYKKALEFYRMSAAAGDADAMLYVGIMHRNGEGCKKNMVIALDYFHKAAEHKCAAAYFYLGLCHELGDGCEQNRDIAIKYYQQGAAMHDPNCHINLASLHTFDNDIKTAKKHLKLAEKYLKENDDFTLDRLNHAKRILLFMETSSLSDL